MKKKILFLVLALFACLINVKAESTTTDPTLAVAKVNDTYFLNLSGAINDYEGDEYTIVLLKDTSELITIPNGKKIVLDLNKCTLSNTPKNTKDPVINNNGTLEVKNGTVTTDAKAGAINNNSKGIVTINGANIYATKLRQALYNKGGQAYIKGDSSLEAVSTERAAVHNLDNGKMYIISGTIVSKGYDAVYNEKGTVNIGTKDGDINTDKPILQGYRYGIWLGSNQSFNFYDGTIKGKNKAIELETGIEDTEDYAVLVKNTEDIESNTYKTVHMQLDSNKIKITFNPVGGKVTPNYKIIDKSSSIGELPVPVKADNLFIGWFTEETEGIEINENTQSNQSITYYAHWNYVDPNTVAYVEGVGTTSLKNALAIGGKVTLLKDVVMNELLLMNKEIEFDLNGHTIDMQNNKVYVYNKVTITDSSENKKGKITSTADFTMIVGKYQDPINANLIVKGGTIEGLGKNGAIRNYETTEIDGGTIRGTATTNSSYVIYNDKDLIMTSGTVLSTNGTAVQTADDSTFTMNGGLVKTDAKKEQAINLSGSCLATINAGTIEAINTNGAGMAAFGNSTLIVNGGTITGYDMAIAGNGNDKNGNVNITINDGTMIATNGIGIYLPQQNSNTTINGGTIEGKTGVEIRAANLIVNGGTITATSDTYEVISNDNGTTTKGTAIAIIQHTTKQAIYVKIKDGTFTGKVAFAEENPMNNEQEAIDKITIDISGGHFISTGTETVISEDNTEFITGGDYTHNVTSYVNKNYGEKEENNRIVIAKKVNVTVEDSDNTIISQDTLLAGDEVTVVLTPKEDYEILYVEVKDANDNNIELNGDKFIAPESDVTVNISYSKAIITDNTEEIEINNTDEVKNNLLDNVRNDENILNLIKNKNSIIELVIEEKELTEEEKNEILNQIDTTNPTDIKLYDIYIIVKDSEGNEITRITELTEDIEFALNLEDIIEDLDEVEDYYVVRYHDKYEIIDSDVIDNVLLVFKSKKYSTYAVVSVKKVQPTPAPTNPTNPLTGDNVQTYILVLVLSIVGLLIGIIVRKKTNE